MDSILQYPSSVSTIIPSVRDVFWAPDNKGIICECIVLQTQGTAAQVHFCGFNKRYDRWVQFDQLLDPLDALCPALGSRIPVHQPKPAPATNRYPVLIPDEAPKVQKRNINIKGSTTIIHWNCNGLLHSNHLTDVKHILLIHKPTFLCLSETKLDDSCTGEENIPGYTAYRSDRNTRLSAKNKGEGGGVLVYAPSNLDITWMPTAGLDFEMGTLDFNSKRGGMRIVTLYRRPGNTVSDTLLDELTTVAATGKKIVLTGDININTLISDPTPTALHQHLQSIFGTQLISEVTRPASNACLDHFWVPDEKTEFKASVLDDSGSDHLPICLTINKATDVKKPKQRKRPNWKAVPEETIRNFIQQYDWRALFLATTLILAMAEWTKFVGKLTSLPPLTCTRQKSLAISPELLSLINERTAARKSDGPQSKKYKDIRNKVVKLNRKQQKKDAESDIAKAGDDSGQKWKVLNKLLGRNSAEKTIPPLDPNVTNMFYVHTLDRLDKIRTETRKKLGNCLPPASDWLPPFIYTQDKDLLEIKTIPEHKTRMLLKAVKSKSAPGPDLMPSFIYKDYAFELAKPLTKIINLSITEQTFPKEWKYAEVIPIYKNKGAKEDPDSYRPVSLLAIAGKILEKAVQLQLKNHLYINRIIPDHQHGFRPNHSTTTCTISIADAIAQNTDKGRISALVALDFSKAFDTINHKKLLNILRTDALLSENSANWMESYLSQRTQSVRVGTALSRVLSVTAGVPQGSVLGPILFTAYTARMPIPEFGKQFMFADDTTLVIYGNTRADIERNTNKALAAIETFAFDMDLFLNIGKTQLVLCSTVQKRRQTTDIQISGSTGPIPATEEAKILGITFDRHLSWATHLKKQAKKATGRCRAIARTGWMLRQVTLSMLFKTLVFSLTDYCDVTWADAPQSALGPIDRITSLAARIACHAPNRSPTAPLLLKLGWSTAPARRHEHRIRFYKTVLKTGIPRDLYDQIPNTTLHERKTRATSRGNAPLPKFRTNYGRKTFQYWSSNIYNHSIKHD